MQKSPETSKSPFSQYAQQLALELRQRQVGNPRYSLRAFALAVGLSPAHLSKVLRQEKRLSLEAAVKVAGRLKYNENETRLFCELVSRAQVKDQANLQVLNDSGDSNAEFPQFSTDDFKVVSDWYHCAIRELVDCRDFNPKPEAIGKRLGITPTEARQALQRLVRVGLLKKHGLSFRKTTPSFHASSSQPSRAIRHFHSQMIQKAREALDAQELEKRDVSAITMAISADKVAVAKQEIRKFRRRMAKLLDTSRPTAVYQLNVQFFQLDSSKSSEASEI